MLNISYTYIYLYNIVIVFHSKYMCGNFSPKIAIQKKIKAALKIHLANIYD